MLMMTLLLCEHGSVSRVLCDSGALGVHIPISNFLFSFFFHFGAPYRRYMAHLTLCG